MTNINQADYIFTATKEGKNPRKFFLLEKALQEAVDIHVKDGWTISVEIV